MIDLHTHILPGVDDGSKDLKMSVEMLRRSARQGVSTLALTPHFYARRHTLEDFLQRRSNALAQLETQLPNGAPNLLVGAEVAYFDGISTSEEIARLQLGDTGLLLVEMPFGRWTPRMAQELADMRGNLGLTPVLAHVNRYPAYDQFPRHCDWLAEKGVLFQCNTEAFFSLLRRGRMLKLLSKGRIHFLGSDTHDLENRPPNMAKAARIINQKLGAAPLELLTARSKDLLGL